MGDNNNCRVPIAIPTIQKLLSPLQFQHLLNAAFNAHIERFPQEFKHCPTPSCSQIYRCSTSSISSILHCPSCLLDVCSSCHKDAHEQMTCKEWALYFDPAEQERLNDQLAKKSGFRKCPECKVWIEKNGGCNHVSCKCGAQICWGCMRTLPGGTIFGHTCTGSRDSEEQFVAQIDPAWEEGLLQGQQQLGQFRRRRRGHRQHLNRRQELLPREEPRRGWQTPPEIPDVFPPQVVRRDAEENRKGCVIM
jgi:hypothetical protein